MTKICKKCGCTMPYDPYFKSYVCRQCGGSIAVPATGQKFITQSGNYISTKTLKFDGSLKKVLVCK